MSRNHSIIHKDSTEFVEIPDKSVALVVTSPPYPMIEMWDKCFADQSDNIRTGLESNAYYDTFLLMHEVLNSVWQEVDRVVIDNGFVCVNIGDATRNCNGVFRLFSNHTKVINFFEKIGYVTLPDILWRKQTNAPNKFLGSGMYPAGAYVTYEHEYILIFRKGGKRIFKSESEKINRRKSAYFWEERNSWFSDLWEFKGTSQKLDVSTWNGGRNRSGAFPFELAYRLINMYSVKGDVVLDPFMGTGTVNLAAIASERNSIGVEIDETLCEMSVAKISIAKNSLNDYIEKRILSHLDFIESQKKRGKEKFYMNSHHGFEVKTRQEKDIIIREIADLELVGQSVISEYSDSLQYNHQRF